MTETQQLATVPAGGRGTKALRLTTHALRRVGDLVGAVTTWTATGLVVAWMANDVFEFTPLLDVTGNMAILLLLAAAGAAAVIESMAYDIADRIDPDTRDGDDLWDAVKVLNQNVADISQGADYDDVRLALQASGVLPALFALTASLRDEYANDGEMEEASALSNTAALVRAAAESFGHKDLGEQ